MTIVGLFAVCMALSIGLQWHSCRPPADRGRAVSLAGMLAFTVCNYGLFLFLFINTGSGELFDLDATTNRALFALEGLWLAALGALLVLRAAPVLRGSAGSEPAPPAG